MKSLKLLLPVALLLIAALYSGCINEAQVLSGPGLGNNQVRKYVAIGNSLSAGYQSNALYESAQIYSFPNLIATQLKTAGAPLGNFEQPIWGDPGNPGPDGKAARYEILSLTGPVVGPAGIPPGALKNSALSRPYDNLGIPGAILFDFLDTTSYAAKALPPRSNPFFQVVLRNPALGKRILDQAKNLKPDLITFWLGYNDVLGYAASGGVSPSAPTDQALFQLLYKSSLDSLRAAAPNAGIVVATIPNVTVIPFFTTIGPRIKSSLPSNVNLQYQKKGEFGVSTGTTNFTEPNPPLICLTGSPYASLLGRPTGQWYRDKGLQVLPGVDTTKPFGLDPRNPWPNALVLDAEEITSAGTAVTNFNNIIKTIAAGVTNTAVCDINAFFERVAREGYYTLGQKYTTAYISGGIFSLDGVHPSSRGHGIMANEFITTINQRWGMTIPLVNVGNLPGIPAPIVKSAGGFPRLSDQAVRDIEWLFRNAY